MDIIEFIQKSFQFLIPGILGAFFYNILNRHKEKHYYIEFLYIISFSFLSFVISDMILCLIKTIFPCCTYSPVNVIDYIGSTRSDMPTANIVLSTVIAMMLTCIITKANYYNWVFKFANKMRLTRRIDNTTVWEHVFDDNSVVVLRDYITENTYYGCVASYSDNSDYREIYLRDVSVYNKESQLLYKAKSFYLSRNHNEFSIETHDYEINNEKDEKKNG